jgi:hypothetical protein
MKKIPLITLAVLFLLNMADPSLSVGLTSPQRAKWQNVPDAGTVLDKKVKFPDNLNSSDNLADYLIIAADPFYKSLPTLKIANHRAKHSDFHVAVVRLSDIYAQFPDSNKEVSIRKFVDYAYYNWQQNQETPVLKYVLLIGDADLDKTTEPWFLPIHTSDVIASYGRWSDNYYVAIDDDNNDGVIDDWDSTPEIRIGRFPVKTVAELSVVVNKTTDYELHNITNQPWLKRVFFVNGLIFGEDILDPYTFSYSGKLWVDVEKKLAQTHKEITEILGPANSPQQVADIINSGVGILLYRGHGWIDKMNGFFTLQDIPLLSNAPYYPIIFAFGCQTGRFQNAEYDSLGEEFLLAPQKGSVIYLGAAHTSQIWLDGHDAEFVAEELNNQDNKTVGDIIFNWKNRPDVATVDRQIYNILGDPALDISKITSNISNKADAALSNLQFNYQGPEGPTIGEKITINVSVDNLGLTAVNNAEVSFFKGDPDNIQNPGVLIGTKSGINIQAQSSRKLVQQWTVDAWGDFSIYVKVEFAGEELFKGNNKIDQETKYNTCLAGWPKATGGLILKKNVADVDPNHPGHEIVTTSTDGRVYAWYGDGTPMAGWDGGIWLDGELTKLPTIGDMDPVYPGLEIVIATSDRRVFAFHADGTPLLPNSNGLFVILDVDNPIYAVIADLDQNYPGLEIIIPTYFDVIYAFHADGSSMLAGANGVFDALGQGFEFLQGLIVADIDFNGDLEVIAVTEHNIFDAQGQYVDDEALAFAWHHDGSEVGGWDGGIQVSTKGTGNAPPIAVDMDPSYPGLEIVFSNTDVNKNIVVLHNDGTVMPGWNPTFPAPTYDRPIMAIGNIDPSYPGLELVLIRKTQGPPPLYTAYKKLHIFHSDGAPMAGWENGLDLPQGLNSYFNIYDQNLITLANIDEDNEIEIVMAGFDGFILAYNSDTTPVTSWGNDKRAGYTLYDAPSLADIDGNGTLDLIIGSYDWSVYAWDLGVAIDPQTMDWPLWRKDPANTGTF